MSIVDDLQKKAEEKTKKGEFVYSLNVGGHVPSVISIFGMAGTGKTTLALQMAREMQITAALYNKKNGTKRIPPIYLIGTEGRAQETYVVIGEKGDIIQIEHCFIEVDPDNIFETIEAVKEAKKAEAIIIVDNMSTLWESVKDLAEAVTFEAWDKARLAALKNKNSFDKEESAYTRNGWAVATPLWKDFMALLTSTGQSVVLIYRESLSIATTGYGDARKEVMNYKIGWKGTVDPFMSSISLRCDRGIGDKPFWSVLVEKATTRFAAGGFPDGVRYQDTDTLLQHFAQADRFFLSMSHPELVALQKAHSERFVKLQRTIPILEKRMIAGTVSRELYEEVASFKLSLDNVDEFNELWARLRELNNNKTGEK